MKATITTALFQNGWSWLIDVGNVSIEPYTSFKKEKTAYNSAIRWCKRFHLDYKEK